MRWLAALGLAMVFIAGIVVGLVLHDIPHLTFKREVDVAAVLTSGLGLLNIAATLAVGLYLQHYVVKRLANTREEKNIIIALVKELTGAYGVTRQIAMIGALQPLTAATSTELNSGFKSISSKISGLEQLLKHCEMSSLRLPQVRKYTQELKQLLTGANRLSPYEAEAIRRADFLHDRIALTLSIMIVDVIRS
jgi:hypothetical protein